MSATSQAPNDGSADTRHVTPAWASRSWASSTAFVRRPTGNWSPTVLAFRPRMTSSKRSVSAMDPNTDASPQKKLCPRGLPFLLGPLNHETPRSRQLHAPFTQGLLRVVHMVLRRGDREDLRAGFHSRGRADGRPKRGAHAFRDPVRARPRRNLVLAEHVVRLQSELQVVRVARLLRDVAVLGDPRRLERDVTSRPRGTGVAGSSGTRGSRGESVKPARTVRRIPHASREARGQCPNGKAPPPHPAAGGHPASRPRARRGSRAPARRSWRRIVRPYPGTEARPERGRRDARETVGGLPRPSGRQGTRWESRRRLDRRGSRRGPDRSLGGREPRRRPRVGDGRHAVP